MITSRALGAPCLALALALASACSGDGGEAEHAGPRGDVFVVVIDTLRRDALRTFDPAMPLGEHFDALARDAIVFDDLRSGTSWTRPAVASLLTGQHAKRHGVHGRRDVLPDTGPSLAVVLREAGYTTRAWSTNPNVLPLWGFGRGFDSFEDVGEGPGEESDHDLLPKADGAPVFERVLDAVEGASGPGFYYVHVIDPHRPYRPPDAVLGEVDAMGDLVVDTFPVDVGSPFTRVVRDTYWRKYLGEVIDVDRQLGAFVARLKELGRYDDATILVVSDHGEEFLEHGGEVHGFTLFEEVLRVPGLLKRAGGASGGTRYAGPVELADMMPTLLGSLGLAVPESVDGRDLLAEAPDPEAPRYADLFLDRSRLAAVYAGRDKLIVDYVTGRAELYDLGEDPAERRDLARRRPERVTELRALLDRARARHAAGWHLRACGCRDRTDALAFEISKERGALSTLDLEPEDTIEAMLDATRAELVLAPDPARAGSTETRRADRDEIVVGDVDADAAPDVDADAAAGLRLSAGADAPLAVAFGRGPIETREGVIELEAERDRARLEASAPVDCLALVRVDSTKDPGSGGYCRPHLRIWYVAAPRSREGELDADLRERLRALGYAE